MLSVFIIYKLFVLLCVYWVLCYVLVLFDYICIVYFISVILGMLNIIVMVFKVFEINCGIVEEIFKIIIMD